ncbi:MAG TPA: ABC transporter permease [Vicinamibacterales bacterium]|nr:ABC transporter permease [Vicinamibacterales bacterium]
MSDRAPWPALFELTRTRILEVIREPEALFWMFVFPVLMAAALGAAFPSRTNDLAIVGVVPGNGSGTVEQALRQSSEIEMRRLDPRQAERALQRAEVQIVVEDADPPVYRYDPARPESRLARRMVDDVLQRAAGRRDALAVREETVASAGARYVDWLLPGLLGMTIMSSGLWGVGFTIVQARGRRLLKRLTATPMRRRDYLLAHALSQLFFLVFEGGVLLICGRVLFGVPLRGSIALVALLAVLGALSFSAIGLLVASRARTIEAVSGMLNLVMLPMWILSGVFFASSNFPAALQPFIQALPLTALNDALRAVLLEGAGMREIGREAALLAGWFTASFAAALRVFRWG